VSLPVRILVRTNVDWRALSYENYAEQHDDTRPIMRIRATTRLGVTDLWKRVFDVDFFEYRRQLQQIGYESVRAADADCVSIGFDDFDDWYPGSQDEIIATIDDDDFFRPPLRELRGMFREDVDVVLWPQARLGFLTESSSRQIDMWPFRHILQTNCALRKSFLQRHFSPPDVTQMLAHHPVANERVAEVLNDGASTSGLLNFTHLDAARVRLIEPCYGLYNVHVGSVAFLHRALQTSDPVAYMERLELGGRVEVPDELQAFEPYVRAFEDVTVTLR